MDCLPQDEYFEWEEVLGYSEASFESEYPIPSRISNCSYSTNLPKTLEDVVESSFEGFQWNDSSQESLSQYSVDFSECTSPSNGDSNSSDEAVEEEREVEEESETINTKQSNTSSYIPTSYTQDDIHVAEQPWRNIDYLSHCWTEEEVCTSWKHLSSTRQSHEKITRLENATWRSWSKVMLNLEVISPQSFNWLKDSDDTRLYGPSPLPLTVASSPNTKISQHQQRHIRPALKKHHISDILLRGSVPCANTRNQTLQARGSICTRNWEALRGLKLPTRSRFRRYQWSPSTSAAGSGKSDTSSWKGVKFLEEVEQYATIEPIPTHTSHLSFNLCSPPPTTSTTTKTIYKLPSTTLSSPADFRRGRENALPSRITVESPASNLEEWMWLSDEDTFIDSYVHNSLVDDEIENTGVPNITLASRAATPLFSSGSISPPIPEPLQKDPSSMTEIRTKIGDYLSSRFGLHIREEDDKDDDAEDDEHDFLLKGGRININDNEESIESMTPDRSSDGASSQEDDEDEYPVDMDKTEIGGHGFPWTRKMMEIEMKMVEDQSYDEMMEEFNLILG